MYSQCPSCGAAAWLSSGGICDQSDFDTLVLLRNPVPVASCRAFGGGRVRYQRRGIAEWLKVDLYWPTTHDQFCQVIGGNMVKVVTWYDNEWGYSNRTADLANLMAGRL